MSNLERYGPPQLDGWLAIVDRVAPLPRDRLSSGVHRPFGKASKPRACLLHFPLPVSKNPVHPCGALEIRHQRRSSRSLPSTYHTEYASGPSLPAASLSDGFVEPREIFILPYSCFNFFLISSAPYRPESNMEPKAGPMRGVP